MRPNDIPLVVGENWLLAIVADADPPNVAVGLLPLGINIKRSDDSVSNFY